MRQPAVFFALALAGAALDLLTKSLAFRHVPNHREIEVIPGFFNFGKTMNEGVIFGMGQNAPLVWKIISILAVPVILAIFFSIRKPKWILAISLGLILAGTLGNMYDRIIHEAVRDFIKFHNIPGYGTWPLFNLADSFICVGVFLLSIEMVFFDEGKKVKKKESAAPGSPPPAEAATGPVSAP